MKFYGEKSITYADVQSSFGDYFYMKTLEVRQMDEFRIQRKKDLKEAIQYYQNSIVALTDSFDNPNPLVNPPLTNILSEIQMVDELKKKAIVMEKLADIYSSEFDQENSIMYYKAGLNALSRAVDLIHRLQIGFENEDSKYFLAQNQQSTFYDAIKISYKLYKQTRKVEYIEKAFEFSERSKSSNLLASVKEMKAKEFGGIPDALISRENDLKSYIATYTSLLISEIHAEKPDSPKVNLFNSKIFKYNEEYNKLIDSFEKDYPNYYAFKYESKVVGINEIQSKLSGRQALVEYYTIEPDENNDVGELYRFVITKDSVNLSMEKINRSYVEDIQTVFDFLTNPNYLYTRKKDYVDYSVASYRLYEKLLKPVVSKISGKDITVIPHDKLSYIPFDALLTELPDTSIMNFRNLNYLIRDYAINYSYSATLLYDFFEPVYSNSKKILAFAPEYASTIARTDPESLKKHYFSPLSAAAHEVNLISEHIHSETYIGSFAQETSFKQNASKYSILHLAMHTIINDSLPMYSKLVFSAPDENASDDGFLNTYEIYNMKLNARLAVLSACETGTGKLLKGEGVMSMARGFIYAGCPSIVMTLWQVEDKAGSKIMGDFYNYLSKGKRKDIALRMAKLNHLKTSDPLTAHPHYWLGYVSIGDPEPLFSGKDLYFVLVIIIIAALFSLDWYFRKNNRTKTNIKSRK
ncbi:MAG: CHAT domain-containing protein [Prolixibacteraceae bacterium]